LTHIRTTVDGVVYDDDVEPRLLLVHYLRDRLGRTGTPVGCDTSNCGACTCHLDGEAVKSCTVLAVQADGAEVTTIEGLAQDGRLHPVQEAFLDHAGYQCGFCTPGMIMGIYAGLIRNPNATPDEVMHGELESHLCRCGAHPRILDAVKSASAAMKGAAR